MHGGVPMAGIVSWLPYVSSLLSDSLIRTGPYRRIKREGASRVHAITPCLPRLISDVNNTCQVATHITTCTMYYMPGFMPALYL